MKKMEGNFDVYDVLIKQKNTQEPSRLFNCTKVELVGNEIMVYKKKELVFKVWLKKDYKDIEEALKDVGIEIPLNPNL